MKKAKQIVATFLKEKEENISESTRIDITAIPGSVLIHRMYSELRKNGFEIDNISNIVTFGDLQLRINGEGEFSKKEVLPTSLNSDSLDMIVIGGNIGIDMESAENLPDTSDYYSHQFYKDNFSDREIGYCSSQTNPKKSFSGRFAAKEAIVKADNNYKNKPFFEIEIQISESGRPLFQGFNLSISHVHLGENQLSIAIAQKTNTYNSENRIPASTIVSEKNNFESKHLNQETPIKKKRNFHIGLVLSSVLLLSLIFIAYYLNTS